MTIDPFDIVAICATPARRPIARLSLLTDGTRPTNGIHSPPLALPVGWEFWKLDVVNSKRERVSQSYPCD